MKEQEDIKLKLLLLATQLTPDRNGMSDLKEILKTFEVLVHAYNKQILIK